MNYFRSIILLIFLSVNILSCSTLTGDLIKDPVLSVNSLNVTQVSLQDISMNLVLNVDNPNPVPLNLTQVAYTLIFSNEKVTEGIFENGVNIPASGSSNIVVPLKFQYNTIGNLLNGVLNNKLTKDYELSGSVKMGIFNIPFSKKGEIKLDGANNL